MTKVDPSLLGKVPLSYFLGTLGMPGQCRAGSANSIRAVQKHVSASVRLV
jgi:hypothetical protein